MTISCTSPRTALVMWAIAVVAVATFVSAPGKQGKLYATFVAAGNHFRTGEPLYGEIPEGQDQYRYSPLVAAARIVMLPPAVEVLARWAMAPAAGPTADVALRNAT